MRDSHTQTPRMLTPLFPYPPVIPSHQGCFVKLKDTWWLWETLLDLATTHVLAQDGTQCQRKYSRWGRWQLHFQLENVHQLGLPHWQPRDGRQQVCIHHHQLQGNPNWHFSVCFWGCSQHLPCQRFKGKSGYLYSISPYEQGMELNHISSSSCAIGHPNNLFRIWKKIWFTSECNFPAMFPRGTAGCLPFDVFQSNQDACMKLCLSLTQTTKFHIARIAWDYIS